MLTQEPYSFCFKVSRLRTYTNQILTGNQEREIPWACVVIFDKDYVATLLRNVSTSHCVCVHISGPSGCFYVVSAFLQYSLPVEEGRKMVHCVLLKPERTQILLNF